MTVAVGIEVGAVIGAGGPAGAGAGPGQSQAAPFALGQGKSEGWLGATNGNASKSSVSGEESFRSNWQLMLRAWDAMPRASSGGADKDAIEQNDRSGAGEIATVNSTAEREGAKGVQVPLSLVDAAGAPQSMTPANQGKAIIGGAARQPSAQQVSTNFDWRATKASRQQILADAAIAGIGAQSSEVSAAADSPSDTSKAGSTTSTHRSNRSERRENALDGPKPELQAQSVGTEPLATPISIAVVAPAAAAPAELPIAPQNLPATPTPDLADRLFSSAAEPASDAGAAESAAIPAEIGVPGRIAATASQTGISARVLSRNPVGATRVVAQEDNPSEVVSSVRSKPGEFARGQQAPATARVGTPAGESEEPHASQPSAPSGSHAVQAPDVPAAGLGTHHGVEANRAAQSPIAARVAEKPSLGSGAQSAQQATARPVHEAAAGARSASAAHAAVGQPAGAAVDGSLWARNPASALGPANSAPGGASVLAGSSTGTPSGPTPRETFAALDSGTAVGTPAWIHAGGQRAEAGFQDPALGWVGVRADLSGGSVHAAVVPGSSEAAEALSGHLAGLNTYLAEQHTPVATLTMAAPGGSGMESATDQGMSQSMQQNAGQHAEQSTAVASQPDSQVRESTNAPASSLSAPSQTGGFDAIAHTGERRGVHISVMA